MSLGSVLNTARSALAAQQVVIDTAGHNIANAQTAGYTRQRVDLQAATPQQLPYGTVGGGVWKTTNAGQSYTALTSRRATAWRRRSPTSTGRAAPTR